VSRRPFVLSALAALACADTMSAQELRSVGRVELALLAGRIDKRDAIISPLRYGGTTTGLRAGYSRESVRGQTEVAIWIGGGGLTSARGAGSEAFGVAGVEAAVVQRISSALMLGLAMDGEFLETQHRYQSGRNPEVFEMAVVAITPVLRWIPVRMNGRMQVGVSLPILTLVARPYSRINGQDVPWTVVGPARWRAASLRLQYTSTEARRIAARLSYDVDVRSYQDELGFTSLENRLRLGALIRLGRSPP
jgi:hypothetical protein